ncbi:MAG: Glu/Leu/Phe/Val dehydrogenase [Melioribacteraceae bacterium]|nr:Glu/Leu/Phe/Val dehydrogenase [Melioribacteraceae bacterium]
MEPILSLSPQDFITYLRNENIQRIYFVYDEDAEAVKASHVQLQAIADFLNNDKRDFKFHEGVFIQVSSEFDTLFGAFIHRTNRGQAAGGLRYWSYDTVEDYLRDGLRLAMGMTHKNALAGLWWGGGKGVMTHNPDVYKLDPVVREILYKEYGEFITSLRGCYVTAEDVGTSVSDMANIFSRTRFTTCIPRELGGSGNPSVPTARGVVAGMEAALEFLGEKIKDKTIALQGMGNVGMSLIKFLSEKDVKKIIAWDIYPDIVERARKEFKDFNLETHLVKRNDNSLMSIECDILSPNATGATLNSRTIPSVKARIICGAANNQLEDPVDDDAAINKKGILYIPDFLTNRMGIVNCADESAGYVTNDPLIERHLSKDWEYSIHQMTLKVLAESHKSGRSTGSVAVELAEKLSFENHPIFGHRGKLIISSLVRDGWEK